MQSLKPSLKTIYYDIIRGNSRINIGGNSCVYVKHFSQLDNAYIEDYYNTFFEKCLANKIPTRDEKSKYLEENNLWTKDKDRAIDDLKIKITNLRDTKEKLALVKSQQEYLQKEIFESEKQLLTLESERYGHFSQTAEAMAIEKSSEYQLFYALFRDESLSKKYFDSEFGEIDSDSLSAVVRVSREYFLNFGEKTLKKIALQPYFLNLFYLCDSDSYKFFGKHIVGLTNYQVELFINGCYFKNLLSDGKLALTQEYIDDPDKLINFYQSNKNTKEILSKGSDDTVATAIVGATKEDLKAMGVENGVSTLVEMAKKKGGVLSKEDLIKFHGF